MRTKPSPQYLYWYAEQLLETLFYCNSSMLKVWSTYWHISSKPLPKGISYPVPTGNFCGKIEPSVSQICGLIITCLSLFRYTVNWMKLFRDFFSTHLITDITVVDIAWRTNNTKNYRPNGSEKWFFIQPIGYCSINGGG